MTLEEYISKYRGIVVGLTTKYGKSVSSINIETSDLYQISYLALIESFYNQKDNLDSSTYAYNCVKYAILNYITKNSFAARFPHYIVLSARFILNYQQQYYLENGVEAPIQELIEALKNKRYSCRKVTEEYIRELIAYNNNLFYSHIYSLEQLIENDELELASENNMEDEVVDRIVLSNLDELFSCLTKTEKDIIIKTIGLDNFLPKTRRELAEQYGITFQGVDFHYQKALSKLKKKIKKLDLI